MFASSSLQCNLCWGKIKWTNYNLIQIFLLTAQTKAVYVDDRQHGPQTKSAPSGCYSPAKKINKAIFGREIVISAPLINFHLSNVHLQPTMCMMKRLKCISHNKPLKLKDNKETRGKGKRERARTGADKTAE